MPILENWTNPRGFLTDLERPSWRVAGQDTQPLKRCCESAVSEIVVDDD